MLNLKRWFFAPSKESANPAQENAWASSLEYRCSELSRMGSDAVRYHDWSLDTWYEPSFSAEPLVMDDLPLESGIVQAA